LFLSVGVIEAGAVTAMYNNIEASLKYLSQTRNREKREESGDIRLPSC
jgi:hypothetical protein